MVIAKTLEAAAKQIGGEVLTVVSDVSTIAGVDALIAAVKKKHAKIDVLFVNAGVARFEPIEVVTEARSFLHHQVRNFVGTLKLVGDGSWPIERVATALAAQNRASAGPTAPPDGLALIAVGYQPDPFAD